MALASAGCEMSSSSYTAGPRPELPGLWAAELASVASTQALQRDGWRDCEAGGSGRRGWARARNRLARSAGGCARARRARAWQAEQARHMVNPRCRDAVPLFRDHFVRPIEGSAGSPMLWSYSHRPRFRGFCTVFGFSLFGRVGVYSGISQWYRVGDAGALRAEPFATLCLARSKSTWRGTGTCKSET